MGNPRLAVSAIRSPSPKASTLFASTGFGIAGLLLVLLSAACSRPPEPPQTTFRGSTMGTTFTVKVVGDVAESRVDALSDRIGEELEGVNSRMSTYLESSELSRFNRFQETETFPLSPMTLEVFGLAAEVSRRSGGAFDITVAPLVEAWGFGAGGEPGSPLSQETVAALRQRVGFEHLEILETGARKRIPELTCDLSAIAKGFAVDQVALALEDAGIDRYMVEVGGEVRTAGLSARGKPWFIGIEGPVAGQHRVQKLVPLSGLSMATSGDYRNFYEVDGKRYSHTIDPRTGRPVEHAGASVSVVAGTCAEADAWATALLVLGPEAGMALARRENLAALFLVYTDDRGDGGGRGVSEAMTPAFQTLLDTNTLH